MIGTREEIVETEVGRGITAGIDTRAIGGLSGGSLTEIVRAERPCNEKWMFTYGIGCINWIELLLRIREQKRRTYTNK